MQQRRAPRYLFADNGDEFTGQLVDLWAYHRSVRLDFARPGKPTDNAHIETFNGRFRDECLNLHWFASIAEARRLIELWRREYNESRPHSARHLQKMLCRGTVCVDDEAHGRRKLTLDPDHQSQARQSLQSSRPGIGGKLTALRHRATRACKPLPHDVSRRPTS